MRKAKEGEFRSKVYADRPPYADFEAPSKFEAIKSIIARRMKEHPNAMCSYSGGSDSDIMLHLIEQVREMFQLPPVKYYFLKRDWRWPRLGGTSRSRRRSTALRLSPSGRKKHRASHPRVWPAVCIKNHVCGARSCAEEKHPA